MSFTSTFLNFRYFLISICACFSCTLNANIDFEPLSLSEAIDKAASEKKLVFVDTYASWCAPCKVMDRVFKEKKVGNYFNQNFINIKIDMEASEGDYMLKEYGVVWLPTLLVLDQSGNTLVKIDKLLSGEELISVITESLSGPAVPITHEFNSTPFPTSSNQPKTKADYNPEKKEEVIYVYDDRVSSGRPHIMYHEAYLHLQLMDGKQDIVVKRYLSTQDDWSTEKNIKFIFDFLHDVHSSEFDYFIRNKARFEEVIGKEKVATSLAFLINQRIEQGFPRVTLRETLKLYGYLFKENVEERAYKTYLNGLIQNDLQLEFINTAKEYLEFINPHDHVVIYQLVSYHLNRSNFHSTLQSDIEKMNHAISLHPDQADYYYTLAKLYYHLSDKEQANRNINIAQEMSVAQNRTVQSFQALRQKINAL